MGASPPTATPAVALSHLWVPLSQTLPHSCQAGQPALPTMSACLRGFSESAGQSAALLVWLFWLIFFFTSLVVGVPCSLIFWCFWLFIDFILVVVLLLVVRGSEGSLPIPPSWPKLPLFSLVQIIIQRDKNFNYWLLITIVFSHVWISLQFLCTILFVYVIFFLKIFMH